MITGCAALLLAFSEMLGQTPSAFGATFALLVSAVAFGAMFLGCCQSMKNQNEPLRRAPRAPDETVTQSNTGSG
jgi:hypothetical protein